MTGQLAGSKYDWQYVTKSDPLRHQALKENGVPWPRGKVLGGSSSINAMLYVRGRDYDFNSWVQAGNPSWSPDNVNYYFKKAENIEDIKLNRNAKIYETFGQEGPLVINSINNTYRDLFEKVIDSWDYNGVKKVLDINSASYQGYGIAGTTRMTAYSGQRESTYTAYLRKAKNRNNLKIIIKALVTKILISNDAKAYGVEVVINGKLKRYFANFEVIVSGGTINTPQLLMLSGIGPREHLISKNIPCIVNLPGVGKNLHDHTSIYVPIYGDEPDTEDTAVQMFDIIEYLYNKSAPITTGALQDGMAFYSRKEQTYPEYQSHFVIAPKNSSTVDSFLSLYEAEVLDSFKKYSSKYALYLFVVSIMHPFSRGEIYLNTTNPNDHPVIDAKYLSDERDIQTSIDGIKIIRNLLNTPYFRSINAFNPRINIPQCDEYEFPSDLYFKCYALQMTATAHHQVGTSRMGPDERYCVVDNFLKVHGVSGLRVIDCSIMPYVTSGNTNAPAIMIGEMGSDMIKADYLAT